MTPSQAILAGALIVSGTLFYMGAPSRAIAQGQGPYQIMHHSNTTANAGVFRLDTASGEVSYCYLTNATELVCSRTVR